ncbi:MAG: TIGR03560 family F420-dependent LLM class oxidoreductase [Dehalococcoidia bacterium]|nr:TIGR03560 family F420-dependent LLM class oxidoreductase [Dehalococcoidia bacterium]
MARSLRFSLWPGPANSWSETLEICRHAEASGWDGAWYADHFMPNAEDVSGATNECFTTLAGLAATVPRIRIGSLVAGNTYRHPAVLAKMAAGIDNISGGRMVLGLGAGWQENEHAAYGIPFHTVAGRLRRLEEACQVVRGLFDHQRLSFEGRYYRLDGAPLEPRPVQQPLPLLVGGGGEQMTLRIAALYANEWNVWGSPQLLRQKMAVLNRHCERSGRDPREIRRSANALLVLTDDEAVIERTRATGRPLIAGNIGQVQETLGQYLEAGVDEVIIPDFNLGRGERRREHLDRFIYEAAAPFR